MNLSANRRNFLKGSAAVAATTLSSVKSFGAGIPKDKTINVALIGCGGRGSGALKNILTVDNNVRVVAYGDMFQDKLDKVKKSFKRLGERGTVSDDKCFLGFDAYKQVLALPEVDVVLLATPPHFRPAHIDAAAEAGKHVFAEKPLATDPATLRQAMKAIRKCEEKGLHFMCGFCYRFDQPKVAAMEEIKKGIIGDIINIQTSYNAGSLWMKPRQPDWSDMEWQMRNWLYFTWLAGDHIVEQAIHSIDKMSWLAGDDNPIKAVSGMGGRISRTQPEFGHIYDHFTVKYEFENGVVGNFTCRQQKGTDRYVGDVAYGTKGRVDFQKARIYNAAGEEIWRFKGKGEQMHQHEQRVLVESLRSGKYFSNGEESIKSCGLGILGRMSAYTGKTLTWEHLMNSKEDLSPEIYDLKASIPTPEVARPGITKFI